MKTIRATPSIVTAPADILHQACEPVGQRENVGDLIEDMKAALRESSNGVGLAAPQIGVAKQVIAISPTRRGITILINPVYVWLSPLMKTENEGCLSYPGIYIPVGRHASIEVRYEREDRSMARIQCSGFNARIVQHEIDHLRGECKIHAAWLAARAKGSP